MKLKKYEGIVEEWNKIMPGYCGYMRMYYRSKCWYPNWFQEEKTTDLFSEDAYEAANSVCRELAESWPDGCNYQMRKEVKAYNAEISGSNGIHLLESDTEDFRYLICIDTRYGNADYPVRVHTYRKEKKQDASPETLHNSETEQWQMADYETFQIEREKEDGVYELYRAEAVDPHGKKDLFRVAHAIIRLEEVEDSNLEPLLMTLGYSNLKAMKREHLYGWKSYLVGCYFEFNAKKYLIPSVGLTWIEAVERIQQMSGYQQKICDDDKFIQFMATVQEYDIDPYHFQYMDNGKGVLMTFTVVFTRVRNVSCLIFNSNDLDRIINQFELPLRICDTCGSVMDRGWTDEFGDTYFCKKEEFIADMDRRYGKGNWRVEPTGKFGWHYEYREGPDRLWMPEPSFYTEWQ